jgi:predicted ATPase
VRRPLHARIAEVLEERFPARAEAEPELLAHHYERADRWAPAATCYGRAAELAAERSADEEATRLLTRGINLLEKLPEGPERRRQELELRLQLGTSRIVSQGFSHEDVAATYRRARALCQPSDGAQLRSQALVGLASVHFGRAAHDAAGQVAREMVALGEEAGDETIEATAHGWLGCPLQLQGHSADALRHFDRAIELSDPSRFRSAAGWIANWAIAANVWSAVSLAELGRPDTALERARRAVELARKPDDPFGLAWTLTMSAIFHYMRRDLDRVLEEAEEIVAITEPQCFPFLEGAGKALRGGAHAILASEPAGVDGYWEGLRLATSTVTRFFGPIFLGLGAEAHAAARQPDRALQTIETGLQLVERRREHFWEPELHRAKGELLLAMEEPDPGHADSLFQRALEIAWEQGGKLPELRAATSLARLWKGRGRSDEARDLLGPVCAGFTEGFDTQDLKDAKALLDHLT